MAKDLVFSTKITISTWETIVGGKRTLRVSGKSFEITIPPGVIRPGNNEGKKTYVGARRKIDGQEGDLIVCFILG